MNAERLTWERANVDFIRSAGGRFDLMFSHVEQTWIAYDWDKGSRRPFPTLAEAQLWCQKQA